MNLPGPPLPQCHLRPGECLVTQEPQWVVTVLGSCVAVTMFNPRFGLAAICHGMLPKSHGARQPGAKPEELFRYLDHAIPVMIERFSRLGLPPAEVEVKMFGGGNVIDLGGPAQNDRLIGDANIAKARKLLQAAGFQIKAQNVGGTRGCKILFNTQTGEVLHKHLSQREAIPNNLP
jgi:chemotaxis protein CheD